MAMRRFRSIAMLLAVVTGLLVIMLVAVFATQALNAYARKQEANHTLMVVRRATEALLLRETVRIELGVMDMALQAREPASHATIAQLLALHARSENGLTVLGRERSAIGKVRARMAEVQNRRAAANDLLPQVMASTHLAKGARPMAVIALWREHIVAMTVAVEDWSNDHSDTKVNADSFIDEMMRVNALAWNMRSIAGADRRNVGIAIHEARPLSIEQREAFADAEGRFGALWTQIENVERVHVFQPRLKASFENARRVYLVAFRNLRKSIIVRLTHGEKVAISGQEWLRLSNPGLKSIIAISKDALAITEWHAARLARVADRNFQIAVGLMLATFGIFWGVEG
ncbi:MAG: hypothetical protein V4601_01795, partial [Pseudomonadota bacterium]